MAPTKPIEASRPEAAKPFPLAYLAVFIALALALASAGYSYYKTQKKNMTEAQYRELSAIADLKVSQIGIWRKERLGDAANLLNSPMLAEYVLKFFDQPTSPAVKENLRTRLSALREYADYENVILVDRRNRIRMTIRDGELHLSGYLLGLARDAMRNKRVVFSDLHVGESTDHIHIDLVAPLVVSAPGPAVGAVIMQIDPLRFLYPRIQTWPTPSPSAETLLVRREGDEVVFLNDLRHRKSTALSLRLPARTPELPAAMAVRGETGIVEGRDYRGIPVLADLRKVPDSSWLLVTKIDAEEIYAPLRERARYIGIIVAALILAAGAALSFIWRRETSGYYRALYEMEAGRLAERRQAEASLRESEERYRLLFDKMMNGFALHEIVCDEDGRACNYRFLEVNESFERLTGLNRAQVLGKTVMDVLPGIEPLWVEQYGSVALTGEPVHFERFSPEFHKYFEVVAYSPKKGLFATIISDVTERKEAEARLKKLAADLMKSNKELEQFAHIASHDLQEPLRMVGSYLQLLERRYRGKLDADADDFIKYAVDGAVRMQRMINDLLAYSRLGSKAMTFEAVDCNAVLEQVLGDLKLKIEEAGAKIIRERLPTVAGDPSQLAQLFQNLIANSIKFRGDLPLEVRIGAERRDDEWLFSLRDNGIGFNPAYAEKIFVIFQRLNSMDKYPGSGIGLTICKKIVERHGGRIWAESEPGKGAVFHFALPEPKSDAMAKPNGRTAREGGIA